MPIKQTPHLLRALGVLVATVTVSLASGCGGAPPTSPPTAAATTALGPTSTYDSQCSSAALDTWLKYSATNTKAFVDLMNASASIKSNQALTITTQLGQFAGRVAATQAPGCAANEKLAIQQMMAGVMQAFKAYSVVPALTLKDSAAITLANNQYGQILIMQQGLINTLTAQLGHS